MAAAAACMLAHHATNKHITNNKDASQPHHLQHQLLLDDGADPNQENRMGMVAFHYLWDTWLRTKDDSLFKVRTTPGDKVCDALVWPP